MKANLIENDYFCGNFSLNNRSLNIRIVVIFLINIHKYFIFICSNSSIVFLISSYIFILEKKININYTIHLQILNCIKLLNNYIYLI